jgi:hypothetical protein
MVSYRRSKGELIMDTKKFEEKLKKLEEENKTMNEVREEAGLPPVQPMMIPVHIMSVCGDQNTPPDKRLSYSQVAFVTPEQFQIINLRLNDMAQTINSFIEENRKNEGM